MLQLDKKDVVSFWKENLILNKRKLSVQLWSRKDEAIMNQENSDINQKIFISDISNDEFETF